MAQNFTNCHTKIRHVDAHATLNDGVVVQVMGLLSNNNQALRRFMQTFVLAPEVRKKSEVVHVFLKTWKKFFWWLRLRHTEVSWARGLIWATAEAYTAAMAMLDPSRICNLHCSFWQRWILHPLCEGRDWTFTLRYCVRFLPCSVATGNPYHF